MSRGSWPSGGAGMICYAKDNLGTIEQQMPKGATEDYVKGEIYELSKKADIKILSATWYDKSSDRCVDIA